MNTIFLGTVTVFTIFSPFCYGFIPCLPNIFAKEKVVQLAETTDPATGIMIFNEYGTGTKKNHVCLTIDKKTNRIFGDAVCKHAMNRLFQTVNYKSIRTKCVYLGLPGSVYDHGEKMDDNFLNVYHFAVKCIHGNGRTDFFHAMNGPENFYYIFTPTEMIVSNSREISTRSEMKAVLNIIIKSEDFPEVKICETSDPEEADNIFGIHGTTKIKTGNIFNQMSFFGWPKENIDSLDPTHVCATAVPNTTTIRGEEICEKILKIQNKTPISNAKSICDKITITRHMTGYIGRSEIVTNWIYAAKCFYKEFGVPKIIAVFNTPLFGFYYVAEEQEKNKWTIQSCMKIEN